MATTFNGVVYPDGTNTGVRAGVTLNTHNGDLVINTPGTVISGLKITGDVYINAANVTIKDCSITNTGYNVVNIKQGVGGAVVENCEINGTGNGPKGQSGIGGAGTFLNNNIHNVENGINIEGSNTVIKGNYIHDLNNGSGSAAHYDGIAVQGGFNNVTIDHNTVLGRDTACVFINNDFGAMDNIVVNNNLLLGQNSAAASIYVMEKAGNPAQITNVQVTNNVIEKGYWYWASVERTEPTWTNNVDYATGKLISTNNVLSGAPTTPVSSPPGVPTIVSFSDDSGLPGDGITNDNTITLTGKAAANSTVKVFDGATQIGTVSAANDGAWSYKSAALSDGAHKFTATATSSGVTSQASAASTVTVDTVAPTAPTIKISTAAATLDSTHIAQLTGAAEANSVVKVFDGATHIGTAAVNTSGAWTFNTSTLANGGHNFTAKAMDAAGNTGAASSAITASIGTSAPTSPTPIKQIEAAGATSLIEISDKFYLNSSSGSGPSLKYRGADFVDGTDGTWTPIGAEKTATGYQVVWKETSAGLYTAWNTDNNGNYVSHVSTLTGSKSGGAVWGTNSSLKLLETSFHQDLNGDGQIGASSATAPIATSGKTIVGTDSRDTLTSTTGNDIMVGKGGSDTFVFAPNFGNDVIEDFRPSGASGWGHDTVQFSKSAFDNFADVLAHATQAGGDVVIATNEGDSLKLKNTKLAALDTSDFHFA